MYTDDAIIECEESQLHDNADDLEYHVDLEALEKKSATQCLCPKCGREHKLKIFWTGRGTPRVYCHRCREQITTICDCAVYESQPDAFRVARGGVSYSEY
jgi:transposase-like protein